MVILTLMAGAGNRFARKASAHPDYRLPKPMIPVLGTSILERTTRSLPCIRHLSGDAGPQAAAAGNPAPPEERAGSLPRDGWAIPAEKLRFAIRREDEEKHGIGGWLRGLYGAGIQLVVFERLTRGNLETALIACEGLPESEDLLILDSDNAYDGSGVPRAIRSIRGKPAALICHFDRLDDDPKWCFAILRGDGTVKALHEKDPRAIELDGRPMAGTFYFDSIGTFKRAAGAVIAGGRRTGGKSGEFYMSQAVQQLIEEGVPVHAHRVGSMTPLGTPEDVEAFLAKHPAQPGVLQHAP